MIFSLFLRVLTLSLGQRTVDKEALKEQAEEALVESTGDVEKDIEEIEQELESLDETMDFPYLNASDFE